MKITMKRPPAVKPTLGPCCCCGKDDDTVRNVLTLNLRAPVPGLGWGCKQCGLSAAGAVAVLCDECTDLGRSPVMVCTGTPGSPGRMLLSDLPRIPFFHNPEFHPELRSPGASHAVH